MTFNIIPAIMIGGAGTRLWPLSRSNMPKQFLRLTDDLSLFQNTMKRVESPMFALPWLLTNSALVDIVNAQVAEIGSDFSGVILEPMQPIRILIHSFLPCQLTMLSTILRFSATWLPALRRLR